ncbi:DUF721 domain-containing protein [Streptomyces sp. NPDC015184]|uniref:DUF721 domain-containing protein n=1 Tax=Streptomyces sp. NPDC015184 TaxID=3364946 RepID=UPI0036F6F698
MTSTQQHSGVDLARQALLAAREAAKKTGHTRKDKPKQRTGTALRRDGREPLGLGSAISQMMTERGLVAPAAGGTLLTRFDAVLAAVVPELAGRAQAVGLDTDTGRLDVVPDSPAAGTKLRWSAPKLIAAAHQAVPETNVHALHVLAPAPMKTSSTAATTDPAPQPTTPATPMERRTPPDGYHHATEARRQAARPPRADAAITEAVERQTAAMRDLSRRAFPEPDIVAADTPAPSEQTLVQRRRQAAATEAAALRRARAERAVRA